VRPLGPAINPLYQTFFRLDVKVKNEIVEFHDRNHKINSLMNNK